MHACAQAGVVPGGALPANLATGHLESHVQGGNPLLGKPSSPRSPTAVLAGAASAAAADTISVRTGGASGSQPPAAGLGGGSGGSGTASGLHSGMLSAFQPCPPGSSR